MEHPHLRGFSEWKLLAPGGLAVVWEARQQSLDRLVAVKVYPPESEEGDRRFLREAAAAGRLSDHPGIVTAHDAGILPDDRPYLTMELCPGGSLTQWLEPENRPSEEQVRQVGVRIAAALAAVHARGVLHRDIRPANILIDSYGDPGLANFGLAATADGEEVAADTQPVTSAYAPPEAFRKRPATESGDVFSLAATLYALLASSPSGRVSAAPVASDQMVEDATKPFDSLPGVNRYVMSVLLTALSHDPAARPTAAMFRDQLANVPPGHSAVSSSPSLAATAVATDSQRGSSQAASAEAPRRRGKRREGILALVVALVAVVASVTAWRVSEPASSGVSVAVTQSATPGGLSSSADPSEASNPGSPTPATTPAAGDTTGSGSAEEDTIQLQNPVRSAKPFQTVRIQGTYRGGADALLRVQRWEAGRWLAFPIPTKTDQWGQFTAYIEFGQPGRYRLRVLDPDSGVTSKPSVLVIKG